MKWKIRITGIAPASRIKIPQIVQVLEKLPGVESENLAHKLGHPPFDFLTISTEKDAQKITSALSRMGLSNQIIPIPPPEALKATKDDKAPKQAPPSKEEKLESKSTEDRSHGTQTPSSKIELRENKKPATGSKIELRENESSTSSSKIELRSDAPSQPIELRNWDAKSTVKKDNSSVLKQILLVVSVLMIGVGVWFLQYNFENTKASEEKTSSPKQEVQESPSAKASSKQKYPRVIERNAKQKQQIKQQHQLAQQQQQYSEKMLDLALKSQDTETSTKLLESSLTYNPYNSKAWQILIENYQKAGRAADAEKAQKKLEHSERVKAVLASLAEQFGTEAQVELKTDAVKFKTKSKFSQEKDFYDYGGKIYDTIVQEHPEKSFEVDGTNANDATMQVKVNSGDEYPSYDEWLSAEKAKSEKDLEKSSK
ncbi:MAG: tetratricopeptide repeat protein [Fibrobacter sp.]|nr:tetratricopeptide repeat protein [Fibrobacter sp.]